MATYKFEINTKSGKDGLHLIMLRVIHNREMVRIATDKRVKLGYWNPKDNNAPIRRTHLGYTKLNKALKDFKNEVEDEFDKLENKTVKALKNKLKSKSIGNNFISYYSNFVDNAEKNESITYFMAVKSRYKRFSLMYPKLNFDDIDTDFLDDYRDKLKNELKYKDEDDDSKIKKLKGLSSNSIISHLNTLRAVFSSACKDKGKGKKAVYIGLNPFDSYQIDSMKSKKEKLSLIEIKRIEALNLDSELADIRNYFLFAFYTAGTRIADLMKLRWRNIVDNHLNYVMGKNGKDTSIYLTDEAKVILNFYKLHTQKKDDYIFPILKNTNKSLTPFELRYQLNSKNAVINRGLKIIGMMAKIDKSISFHMSRHSFADYLRQKKVSVYDIKSLLNHSSIKQTENYLKDLDQDSKDDAIKTAFE